MGTLEQTNKSAIRRTKVNKAIIATIGAAGILSVAHIAPGVFSALGIVKLLPQRRAQIRSALTRMVHTGYIVSVKTNAGSALELTDKGRLFLTSSNSFSQTTRKGQWDGKWRIVIYDFKEPAKTLRARVRGMLTQFGFVKLQNSVWVSPYDCEDLVVLLKADLRIGKNLLYIIADQIENDAALQKHFSLPSSKLAAKK